MTTIPMFMSSGPARLVTVYARDLDGNRTDPVQPPPFVVMLTPEAYAEHNGALDAFRFDPVYLDDCWAADGDYDPRTTTVYLSFPTEQECRNALAAYLAPPEPI